MSSIHRRVSGFLIAFFFLWQSVQPSHAEVKLIVPNGYLPGRPFLARVELRDAAGRPDREVWDAEASLTADQPGVTLSTNRVTLRNGLGTVLLTIAGSTDFNLRSQVNGEVAVRPIANRSGQAVTTVSGTLPGAITIWSGVVNVTGNIVVPDGHTLTIQPGTSVFINGAASGTAGVSITVDGVIRSLGTELSPITITSSETNLNWGQIIHRGPAPSVYEHTFISKGGRAPGEGHTGTGPVFRVSNTTLSLDGCVIADATAAGIAIGKVMMARDSDLHFENCAFARARMGPEITGSAVLCTNSYIMEMYGPDDADGIYLHDSGGRDLRITRCVFAGGDDDAVDTLNSSVVIEDSILRDWPNPNEDAKAVSAFHGEVILRRCLIANCFAGVASKSGGPLGIVRIDHCTISAIDKGLSAATKSNATVGNLEFYVTNSIIRAPDAIHSDFGPERFVSVTYCNLSESWTGAGNSTADPLFVNANNGNFKLQPASPCIDAGDPAAPPDDDLSRSDIGFYTGASGAAGFFLSITSPLDHSLLPFTTNIEVSATAATSTGSVTKVEFYAGASKLGEDAIAPYVVVWSNALVGNYVLSARALRSDALTTTSSPVNVSIVTGGGPSTNVLVERSSNWKFLDNGSDQGTGWTGINFNDAAWNSANAQFGYGDGDEVTPLTFGPNSNNKYVTYYFRKTFVLDDEPARVRSLTLSLLRDDGAVIYLNGQEAHRVSMPAGPVNFTTYATDAGEYSWEMATLPSSLLRADQNIIAVEVHQGNANSSDLSFDLGLTAVVEPPTNARPSVVISSPQSGSIFGTPANIMVSANAADFDGSIANVFFLVNGNEVGADATPPYSAQLNSLSAGNFELAAIAVDNFGQTSTSEVVFVTVSMDTAPPTLVTQNPAPGRATNLTEISVTFSKEVTGIDAADLLVNGVPAERVAGAGRMFTFTFPSLPAGLANVTWSSSHRITDLFIPAGGFDHNAIGATWQYQLIDSAPPEILSVVPLTGATVPALTNIIVTFVEPVAGVGATDLLINGLPAAGVSGSGAGPYTFTFSQPVFGNVLVNWASAHGIQDLAGNPFAGASWSYVVDPNQSAVVISEIMYHPASENSNEEYIELFNRASTAVNLNGWRFTDGVDFVFPNVSIPAGGYLVIAADLTTFRAKYPSVANVIGGWAGSLSNSREDIDLDNAGGARMDSVRYADEGDWAVRQRGNLDRGERGWRWFSEHDGLGKSAELINPGASNNSGQNWASSLVAEGTPGQENSVLNTQAAPIIEEVAHFPVVPKSTEPVVVTARIGGSSAPNPTAILFYRVDNVVAAPFTTVTMRDDGQGGDASAGDNLYTAALPPQTNNTVVEFYVTAADSTGGERSWPVPAIPALDGTGPSGQVANALYQVDDSDRTSSQPLYKMIVTELERQTLERIGSNIGGTANSDAQMNATFISIDGTSTDLHYLVGVRNRGHGTRTAKPNNFRVNFRSDQEWKGVLALNLNAQFSWLQVLGAAIHTKSGSVGAYSRAVQVRVNNANLVFTGGIERTYGSYAANEVIDADWADHHFPNDGNGNVYRAIRDLQPTDFDYRTIEMYPGLYGAENKDSYTNTWFKETNVSEDDWSDLIAMLRVIGPNGTTPFTTEEVERVANVEQWLRHLALMNLLGNSETGLNSGYNDDYFMYRGVEDPRFVLMYYDLDQILGFNGSFGTGSQLFSAENNPSAGRALSRILRHPEYEPVYYQQLRELLETTFSANEFNALVDQVLGNFVPLATRDQLKAWMEARRAFVMGQLPATPLPAGPIALISGPPRSPTPRSTATFQVSGEDVTHYRYTLNGGPLSAEAPVSSPIILTDLPNGTNTLAVIGKSSGGAYQSTFVATRVSWVVNSSIPPVRLNEVIASRSGNLRDQVELYNEGTATVDLAGLRVTDDAAQPGRFTFGVRSLAPGAFLVLDSAELGFSLDATGEGVFLFDRISSGGALLDSVQYGLQVMDWSIGRVGETGEWRLMRPSFGQQNTLQPLASLDRVRINEWLASGLSPFPDDFIELYNPADLPVAIGGAFLTDHQAGDPTQSRIADLSFIAPRGYVAFVSGNGNSSDEINFMLAAEQGEIALLAPDLSVIDSVIYGPQFTGVAMGRCPDGAATQTFLQFPTPGAPNECPVPPVEPQAVVIVPFNHIWKYNDTGENLGSAWKELSFDDTSWPSGPGVLGFENSQLPEPLLTPFPNSGATTYYFRTSFKMDSTLAPSGIQITHLVDDGVAFYLNGQEIGTRYNLLPGATSETPASGTVGEAGYQTFTIPLTSLQPGTNVLAAEVHQVTRGSSDMVFGLRLDALIVTNSVAEAGVLINEVFANNSGFPEPDGSTPDWLELYNPSTDPVDLGGMSLSDDRLVPTRWMFPAGSLLPGRGFTRVAFSADQPVSGTNTGFGLAANGGGVFLFNKASEGRALQSFVTYGLQAVNWSIGRVPDGSTNWVLTVPSLGGPNIGATLGNPQLLKINEWMADPAAGGDWFEIFNPNAEPVEISHLLLSDNLTDRAKHSLPPLSFIGSAAHAFQKFEADELLTEGADHVSFRLGAGGESLAISTQNGVLINGVSFGAQQTGIAQGRLLDGGANIVSFPGTASPGAGNYLPLATVVVNEVLSSSTPPLLDAVELHNPTSAAVDIGAFFLSDSADNLRKYQIPPNRVIAPGGYLVIQETEFNSDAAGEPFSFSSSSGDEVFLSEAINGVLTGYRASVSFGAADPDISFGRIATSRGAHFVALNGRSLGTVNGGPKVGPIAISEVMYRPTSTNELLEFIELHNVSAGTISLFDTASPSNTYRLRRGVEFEFPQGVTIPSSGYVTLVSFDPELDLGARAAFEAAYGPVSRLFGPYRGRLSNSGDVFELEKPGVRENAGSVAPYISVDTLEYDDALPWPGSANGGGASLQRINLAAYGNDPVNWTAGVPNPGGPSRTAMDSDGDGMSNNWETLNGLDPNNAADAATDLDQDGFENRAEFLAGTDPRNASDHLALRLTVDATGAVLTFRAVPGKSYSILYTDSLGGTWRTLITTTASVAGEIHVPDAVTAARSRYYRLILQN